MTVILILILMMMMMMMMGVAGIQVFKGSIPAISIFVCCK